MANLSLFFLLAMVSSIQGCPTNCFCSQFNADCMLDLCADALDTEYDMITIYGKLCDSHRFILQNIIDGTTVVLKNHVCGDIPNCR